jgi:hypothetical protein
MEDDAIPAEGRRMGIRSLAIILIRLKKLAYVCNKKRLVLIEQANKRNRRRKLVNIAAGVLALLSGSSVSVALANVLNQTSFSILGAVLAFVSGVLSLITSTYYDDKETRQNSEGAAAYGALRDRAEIEVLHPSPSNKQSYEALKRLWTAYGDISSRYDHLIVASLNTWPSSEASIDLPSPTEEST